MPPTPQSDHMSFWLSLTVAGEWNRHRFSFFNLFWSVDRGKLKSNSTAWTELSSTFLMSSWDSCVNTSIVYMDGIIVFFQASCLARCVLCGRCSVENSHGHGQNARQFFGTAFSSAVYSAAGSDKKEPFAETELSPIFRWGFLARWVLCGSLASKECDLHGRNSRQFFLRSFWSAFAVPPYTQITRRIAMISQWKKVQF